MSLHYKKDGSLDMRYTSSREAMSSGYGGGSYGNSGGSYGYGGGSYGYGGGVSHSTASYGSRGSSDLHYKKDGSLDMRYSSSRAATSAAQSNYTSPAPSSSNLHYKKDGTLDMRYSSSRAATSAAQSNYTSREPSSSDLHYKKDGTLDMRYSSSRAAASVVQSNHTSRASNFSELHHKKDGTLDMRYNSSKAAALNATAKSTSSKYGIPNDIPTTKAGIPDMRTKAAKEWVKQQAQCNAGNIPAWIPRTKDGTLDFSKTITQEYMKWRNVSSTENNSNQREEYYYEKLRDELFRALAESARQNDVDIPQCEILPETQEIKRDFCCPRRKDDEYDLPSEISESAIAINYGDISLKNELGRGAFGVVYKAIWNDQIVAVKQLHVNRLTRHEKNSFVKEIRIMSALGRHPNLVYLHGYVLDPPCLVMEYVELGSLSYLLHYCENAEIEARMTDGRIKKRLILGIVSGMIQLHAAGIVHGDLKPQNVLISEDYTAKVTDFGFATLRGKTSSSVASSVIYDDDDESPVRGTAGYMAPELLDSSKPPEYSSDVYSFGVVLNEVIQEEEPYTGQYQNLVGRGPFAAVNYAKLGNRPTIKSSTPIYLKNLIERCWHPEPRCRPSFEQIFKELKPSHITFPNSFEL